MVSSFKEPLYQCKGTYSSVSDTEETSLSEKLSYSDSHGQPDSSHLSPKRGLSIPISERSGSSNNQAFNQERLVPYSSSPCRSEDCSSRFSLEGFTSRIGMVSRLDLLSGSSSRSSQSPDRSVCFPGEPQNVHTDARTLDWNTRQRFCLFPPVNFLLKVLENSELTKRGQF